MRANSRKAHAEAFCQVSITAKDVEAYPARRQGKNEKKIVQVKTTQQVFQRLSMSYAKGEPSNQNRKSIQQREHILASLKT